MKKNIQIGLFVGDEKLHCAVVYTQRGRYHIKQLFSVNIDSGNTLAALKKARRSIPFYIRHTTVALQYSQVMIKELMVDVHLKNSEIYQHLKQQTDTFFEMPAKACFFDFTICNSQETNDGQIALHAVATSQKIVSKWLSNCKQSGFIVHAVEVDRLALTRLLPTLLLESEKTAPCCAVEKLQNLVSFEQSDHPLKALPKQLRFNPNYWSDDNQQLPNHLSSPLLYALSSGIYPHDH